MLPCMYYVHVALSRYTSKWKRLSQRMVDTEKDTQRDTDTDTETDTETDTARLSQLNDSPSQLIAGASHVLTSHSFSMNQ